MLGIPSDPGSTKQLRGSEKKTKLTAASCGMPTLFYRVPTLFDFLFNCRLRLGIRGIQIKKTRDVRISINIHLLSNIEVVELLSDVFLSLILRNLERFCIEYLREPAKSALANPTMPVSDCGKNF